MENINSLKKLLGRRKAIKKLAARRLGRPTSDFRWFNGRLTVDGSAVSGVPEMRKSA